ncbi:copper chaperone PCu(A)C [Saccharothrix hoggarensis]|uniref:Copper chaperone PCu(A)C n=1 Tax=Saccharothrix hoggarensis TaxID=913853 RepID=A0ABW3QQJ6_9PSEU
MDWLRTLAALAAPSLAVSSCGPPLHDPDRGTTGANGQVGDVRLRDVVVEAPPDHAWRPGDAATVRLTLLGPSDEPDVLTGVRSDDAARVELWADADCDGVSERVDTIAVPAANELDTGYHLRLVGFTREVLAGTAVRLTFTFQRAGEVALTALVAVGGDDVPPPTCGTSTRPAPGEPPTRPEVTLRGRVEEGVEPGCLVLATDRGQFLLLGGDPEVVRPGADVVVEGVARPGEATTCQQGTPFAVREAEPAPTTR